MKILALDTSGNTCSVALSKSTCEIVVLQESLQRQNAAHILPLIQNILSQEQLALSNLDTIAFSAGPGSFTGIRLAASVTQGLAYSAGLSVIAVSSLQHLAQAAYAALNHSPIIVAINAFAGSIYWGVYENIDGIMQSLIPDQRSQPQALAEILEEHKLIEFGAGDAWIHYTDKMPLPNQGLYQGPVNASHLLPWAFYAFKNNLLVAAQDALPSYLYEASCWRKQ